MTNATSFANRAPIHPASLADYQRWEQLLRKWNARINLVAPDSLDHFWNRHALDSAQILPLVTERDRTIVDFGSGAGFPALALAIDAKHQNADRHIHMIESVGKKASFLKSVSRETALPATIHAARIEALPSLQADLITARAFAPLGRILPLAMHHLGPDGRILLLKGANVAHEIKDAQLDWSFDTKLQPSMTEGGGQILLINELKPR
ncbi:16S rRNA (guanine(527)-N(7))-methyltransferase RsmG [Algimonas porphyrae]|uniref:Ribosomal RNA small subunit methyltransferase G n=1 Tax=Algimonas porphyrae TaxID=1128113 RepID=A0ABQ5V185_9PROT|nr:16S rRNA (guanine(527)-N(7))-methyltransferase RsmG [Algimonas porphyrae]GLQ20558.1 ribosomal RNA small subunit methyltransferase G [Algimonas porphyrae]